MPAEAIVYIALCVAIPVALVVAIIMDIIEGGTW